MLVFLVAVGTPLFLWGEQLEPSTPAFQEEMHPHARLLDRGRGELAEAREKGEAPAVLPRGARKTTGTTPDDRPLGRGPWTLFGTIRPEGTAAASTIGGIGVELLPLGNRPLGAPLLHKIAGPAGSFRCTGLFSGAYRLRAVLDANCTSHLPIAVDVELPAIEKNGERAADYELRRDLTLPVPRPMKGAVFTRGRKPRAGVLVRVSETGLHRGTAVSGSDGTFEIAAVGPGPFEIEVRDDSGQSVPVEGIETAKLLTAERVEVAILIP